MAEIKVYFKREPLVEIILEYRRPKNSHHMYLTRHSVVPLEIFINIRDTLFIDYL